MSEPDIVVRLRAPNVMFVESSLRDVMFEAAEEIALLRQRIGAADVACAALIDEFGTDDHYWSDACTAAVDRWREVAGR